MLGMMNVNLDEGVEFYAARREIRMSSTSTESNTQSLAVIHENDDLQVFVEHKEKPKVSYTKDGRKLSNGQLSQSNKTTPPEQWKQLILTTAAKKALSISRAGSGKNKKRRSFKKMKSIDSNADSDMSSIPSKESTIEKDASK